MCWFKVSITHETITCIRGKKNVTIIIIIPNNLCKCMWSHRLLPLHMDTMDTEVVVSPQPCGWSFEFSAHGCRVAESWCHRPPPLSRFLPSIMCSVQTYTGANTAGNTTLQFHQKKKIKTHQDNKRCPWPCLRVMVVPPVFRWILSYFPSCCTWQSRWIPETPPSRPAALPLPLPVTSPRPKHPL